MRAIILTTKLFGPGGVERFGRQIADAAYDILQPEEFALHLISLADDPTDALSFPLNEVTTIDCFNGRKLSFSLFTAWNILVNARFVYVFHLHLAPIVFLVSLVRRSLNFGVHLHGIDAWRKLPYLRRVSLKRAKIITTSSNFTADKACEYNPLDRAKFKILYPAYDHIRLGFQRAGEERPTLNHDFTRYLLTVARLDKTEKEKGIEDVLRALPSLLGDYPGLGYIVVGTGDDLPRLITLANNLDIETAVVFPGRVKDVELANFYSGCELFIMPSRKEGLGIVFLEAMAFSKPVIACNYGGSSEVVVDGETGFLVPYGDITEIRLAIKKILDDPKGAIRMGASGRQFLDSHFNQSRLREDLISVFDCLTM